MSTSATPRAAINAGATAAGHDPLQVAMAKEFFARSTANGPLSLVGIIAIAYPHWGSVPVSRLLIWALLIALPLAGSVAWGRHSQKALASGGEPLRLVNLECIFAAFSGIAWGTMPALFASDSTPELFAFRLAALALATTFTISTLSYFQRIWASYVVTTWVLAMGLLYATETDFLARHWTVLAGLLVYLAMTAGMARSEHRRATKAMKDRLAVERQSSILGDMVAARTAELTRALDRLHNLSLVIEQSPESILITDTTGRIEYVNDAMCEVSGYSRSELVGHNARLMKSGKTPRETYAALWQALSAGKPWKGEFINQCKDGTELVEFALIAPIRQKDGKVANFFAIKEDITEKKHIGQELDQHRNHLETLVEQRTRELIEAKVAAEAANVAKSAFLANMSHEIRTPLNAIIGFSTLIRRGGLNEKQLDWLAKHDVSVTHLLDIINSVLDLSKIEAGKFVLDSASVRLEEIAANVVAMLEERARQKHLALTVDVPRLAHGLVGDPARLQQALLNYAGNAVKFTSAGSVAIRIGIQEETTDRALVRFEVTDTGVGIEPEAIGRLFSPFEQADNSITRKFGGTGLGLVITRKLADLMGGSAGVSSTAGKGSTFWFTVWLGKEEARPPAPLITRETAERQLRDHHGGHRILLVEDEPVNRELTAFQLAECRQVVDLAEDGIEAVALAARNRYDLILMDVQMPRLDGLEATRQIRQLPTGAGVPIIAMTANVFVEDRKRCLAAGMNDFISKPAEIGTLFATVLKWIAPRTPP